jgi:hypothetical protein
MEESNRASGAGRLKEYRLGPGALDYIRATLADGKTLSKLLLELPLEDGQVVTYLPSGVRATARHHYNVGGVAKRSQTEPYVLNVITAFLQGPPNRVAVFEDALARPSDPVLRSTKVPFVYYDGDVYYFLTSERATPDLISNAVRTATSYRFVCMLSDAAEEHNAKPGTEVSLESLKAIAHAAQLILVSAYDGESVVIWTKSSNPSVES